MGQSKSTDDYKTYRARKTEAKAAVAKAKAAHHDELYKSLETSEGVKKIYRLAATRHKSSLDIGQVKNVRNQNGQLLRDPQQILDRWREHFRNISNTAATWLCWPGRGKFRNSLLRFAMYLFNILCENLYITYV